MRVYTLGYQGLDLDAYTRELLKAGAGIVLDVREKAWSNRPNFIKANLQVGLSRAGIDYVHVQSAGNPSAIRKTAATPEECLTRYAQYLRNNAGCIGELYIKVAAERGRPACLTCYEHLTEHCHRSVLIAELLKLDPKIEPVPLPITTTLDKRPFKSPDSPMRTVQQTAFLHPLLLPIL